MLITSIVSNLPGFATLVLAAVLGWYVVRGQGGTALAILQETNTVLAKEVERMKADQRKQEQVISHLEAQRSLEPIVAAVVNQFEAHEERAQERHLAMLAFLSETSEQQQKRHEAMLAAYSQLGAAVTQGIARASSP